MSTARRSSKKSKALPSFTRTLRFAAREGSPGTSPAETLVVYAFEGGKGVEGIPGGSLRKEIEKVVVCDAFRAKRGRTLLVHPAGRPKVRRVVVTGLGKQDDYGADAVREAAAAAARVAGSCASRTATYALPPSPRGGAWSAADRVRMVAEGFLLGTYRMTTYITGEEQREEAKLHGGAILVARGDLAEARGAARTAFITCEATNLARDLGNEPAIHLTPTRMAEIAAALAKEAGIECRVHDEADMEKMKMGAFLGVSRGSHQPPRFVHLIYRPAGAPARKIALVGKGLTFDSGGLSLKSPSSMETMKHDKAGASAVLAAMLSLPRLEVGVEVHGLLGMTENMPGGAAIRPGDIVRSHGGRTIEVLNTDAEGRLVLADLLSYARALDVDEIIDIATLTGACVVALGPLAAGLFSNDPALADRLLKASDRSGEKMWPLPIYEEYRDQIRSDFADVKNSADRFGGAISAALFLREFAGRTSHWAHLDIAGPAWADSGRHLYMRRGATGAGVRTLLTYLASISAGS